MNKTSVSSSETFDVNVDINNEETGKSLRLSAPICPLSRLLAAYLCLDRSGGR